MSFIIIIFSVFLCEKLCSEDSSVLRHNPWELIIYRPENAGAMNETRCWLKIEDSEGNDVTYTAVKASYEWVSNPDIVNFYEKTYYLSGGMAMHLIIKSGKYRISFYTPKDRQYPCELDNMNQWESNVFMYDTENPVKVIFVAPTADENGFYDGGWHIDYKAPEFWKFTKPVFRK